MQTHVEAGKLEQEKVEAIERTALSRVSRTQCVGLAALHNEELGFMGAAELAKRAVETSGWRRRSREIPGGSRTLETLMIMAASLALLAPLVPSVAAHAQCPDRTMRGAGIPVMPSNSPITFGVFGGAALPSGEYEDAFAAGLDLGIRVNVRGARRVVGVHVDAEYMKNGVRTGVCPNADCSGRILAGFINLDLGLPIPLAAVRSYATAGLGYANVKLQAAETSAPISSSDGTIAWNVGGGARLSLGNLFGSWGAFAEARFIRLAKVDVRLGSYLNESGAISMKPVSVGLTFHPCWTCAELER